MSARASFALAGLLALVGAQAGAASGDSSAAPAKPGDFAYGMTFRTEGVAAAFITALPPAVYQGIVQPDFSDIAVFNERDEVVPHVLQLPRTESTVQQAAVSFPVFALRGNERSALEPFRVIVEAGGVRFDVKTTSTAGSADANAAGATTGRAAGEAATDATDAADASTITSYLLDGRALSGPISAMQIGWPTEAPQFAGRLKVEASDDLGHWETLVDAAPIANLRAGDARLVERRVETRSMRSKFWRLSWVGERAPFEITSVTAEPAGDRQDIGRPSSSIVGVPVAGKPGEFEFDLGAHYPVDRVNLELPEPNSVVDVQLLSRASARSPWLPVTRSGFYRLKSAGPELVNGDVRISSNSDRYWLARADVRGNGLGSGKPTLRVAWAPHEIVFLARGAGPFRLAYGKASETTSNGRIASLPKGARLLPAVLGDRETLGGESRRELATGAFPGRTTILWTVLGLGVALLVYMAYRLSRELKR